MGIKLLIENTIKSLIRRASIFSSNIANNNKLCLKVLACVIASSTILKIVYVFLFTKYKRFIFADMLHYWSSAEKRYRGYIFDAGQWNIFPPVYHIIICELFKIINFFGLLAYKLEIVLFLQILLCSLSVYILYKISLDTIHNKLVALFASGTYAFSYVMIYFKAFVLSENIAIPLVIFSVWCLFRASSIFSFLCGIFLAIATGIRPGYAVLAFPYVVYIILLKDTLTHRLKNLIFFFSIFALVILLICQQNDYISKGKVKGLGANGGINFFLAFTKTRSITSLSDDLVSSLAPALNLKYPKRNDLLTMVPFHDNKVWFKCGLIYIRHHPIVLLERIRDLIFLYFGPLFPSTSEALWFKPLLLLSKLSMFIMTLVSFWVYLVFKSGKADNLKLYLLISIPLLMFVVHYFFCIEYRFLYGFAFVIHITFFATLFELARWFKKKYHIY